MAELSEEAVERPAKRARVEESLRSLIARFKCSITRELLRNGSFYVSHNIRRRRFAIMMRVLIGQIESSRANAPDFLGSAAVPGPR